MDLVNQLAHDKSEAVELDISESQELNRQHEQLLRWTQVLILLVALGFCESPKAAGPNDWLFDRAGARMMSYRALIEKPEKFDRKPVWVVGELKFKQDTAYLGEISNDKQDSLRSVCVTPTESFSASVYPNGYSEEDAILRRFDGLGVSVHGRFERGKSPKCPNGTVFAALLEISFE